MKKFPARTAKLDEARRSSPVTYTNGCHVHLPEAYTLFFRGGGAVQKVGGGGG